MERSLVLATLFLTAGLALPGCRSHDRTPPLSPPAVTVELQNLSAREREVLIGYLEGEARRRWRVEPLRMGHDGDALTYRVQLRNWAEQQALHEDLVALRAGPGGHRILQNHRSTSALQYTSSRTRSSSMAEVVIRVVPADAELVFDTRVPGIGGEEGRVVKHADGTYRVELPFWFIKDHDHIDFHSVFKGQVRHYRYHLGEQRQVPRPERR